MVIGDFVLSVLVAHTSPSRPFSFCCCCLAPNFPRKTPPRYMPCSAAGRLWSQGLGITQSSRLHKHRSFHNVFSSAGPPLNEKAKQKQDPELFQGCYLSVSQITCENKSRGKEGAVSFLEPRNSRLLSSSLTTLSQDRHTRTHTHAHTHTKFPGVNFCQLYQAGTFLTSKNFYQK